LNPEPTARQRPWRVLLPWVAARWLYGPYGAALPRRWREGDFGAEFEPTVGGVPVPVKLDPVLRVLVPVRAWLGLGVLVLLVKIAANPDPGDRAVDVWYHGAITMVLGPYGVFLAIGVLWLLAGRGGRVGLVAAVSVLVSVGVFGLQIAPVRRAVQGVLDDVTSGGGPLVGLLGAVAGPWLVVFGICAVFLMHRNGFSAGADPYLRPLVTSWLACTVAAAELTIARRDGVPDGRFVLATLAGPVLVVLLGLVEVLRLRRAGRAVRTNQWNLPQG
jgi:hypothetical protein